MTKLKVASPDSILSLFKHSGFLTGHVFVEGTTVPLSGAMVILTEQTFDSTAVSSGIVVRHRADSNGAFSFDFLPEGQYYLESDCPAYFSYTDSVWIESQKPLIVAIELVPDYSYSSFHKTGSVQFEVTDESTGELIDGASIYLRELNGTIDTDLQGVRFLHFLKPMCYHFYVIANGFNASPDDSANVVAGASSFHEVKLREIIYFRNDLSCHENHHRPYPVSMIDPTSFGAITGKVIDDNVDEPICDAYVYLAPYGIETTSDSTGTFTFRGLRPGVYCATARVPGFYRTTKHEIQVMPSRTIEVNLLLYELPSFFEGQ